MLAAGVDNKPVLFHCILVNPISIIRQHGPLVKNQRWTRCCCSSWCFYALAWYRHASLLRRHCMTITLRVRGKREAVEDRYCCCCCWCCCSAITILNSYILPPIIYLTLYLIWSHVTWGRVTVCGGSSRLGGGWRREQVAHRPGLPPMVEGWGEGTSQLK